MRRFFHIIGIFLSFVIVVYFLYKAGILLYKKYTLQLQINAVKSQVKRLEKSNEELQTLLAEIGDTEFLKLKAKGELNLKEDGEKVVVVKSIVRNEDNTKEKEEANQWIKWWNIFFGKR